MHLSNIERAHMNKPRLIMGTQPLQNNFMNTQGSWGNQMQSTFGGSQYMQQQQPFGLSSGQGFYNPNQQFGQQSGQGFYTQNGAQYPQQQQFFPQYQYGGPQDDQMMANQMQLQFETPQNQQQNQNLKINQSQAKDISHNIKFQQFGGSPPPPQQIDPQTQLQQKQEQMKQQQQQFDQFEQQRQNKPQQSAQKPKQNQQSSQQRFEQSQNFKKQDEINDDNEDHISLLSDYSIYEEDEQISQHIPECISSPQEAALMEVYEKQLDIQTRTFQESEQRGVDVYNKIGRKQYEVNELIFNANMVKEQKQKSQDLMKKGLETEIQRLEKEADEFEKQVQVQDQYLQKMAMDVDVFEQKIQELKFVEQNEGTLRRVNKAMKMQADKKGGAKYDIQESSHAMNVIEINAHLERIYQDNNELFLEIEQLVADVKKENLYMQQDEQYFFDTYIDNPVINDSGNQKLNKSKQDQKSSLNTSSVAGQNKSQNKSFVGKKPPQKQAPYKKR